jgi:hypothetical protein
MAGERCERHLRVGNGQGGDFEFESAKSAHSHGL